MKKPNILNVFIVILLVGILAMFSYITANLSSQLAGFDQQIAQLKNKSAIKQITIEEINKSISDQISLLKPRDGQNGINGVSGVTPNCYFEVDQCKGKDSVSTNTNTVVQKETIIEKQAPPENGIDGKTPQIGISLDGVLMIKYDTDRNWNVLPKVNITVGNQSAR